MFISAILDPHALESLTPPDARSSQGLELCLRGILANGQMLDDPHRKISKAVKEMVEKAALRDPQLGSLFVQIIQKFYVQMPSRSPHVPPVADIKLLAAVAADARADFVLTRQLTGDLDFRRMVKPEVYGTSEVEIQRRQLLDEHRSLDKLTDDQCDQFLCRLLRFAPYVRIYDRQIGRAAKDLRPFLKGISWFLDGWQKHRLAGAKRELVEIITAAPKSLDGSESVHERETKQKENQAARDLVQRNLVELLAREHGVQVQLSWKNDADGIFHARHIQTATTCVHVDRGFDIFRHSGSLHRNILKCGRSDGEHLTECRGLPGA